VDQLARAGSHIAWLAYLVSSLVLGLAAAGAGWRSGKVVTGWVDARDGGRVGGQP
jgi:CrcB protein